MGKDVIYLNTMGLQHYFHQCGLEIHALVQCGTEGPFLRYQFLENALQHLWVKGSADIEQVAKFCLADLQHFGRCVAKPRHHDVSHIFYKIGIQVFQIASFIGQFLKDHEASFQVV